MVLRVSDHVLSLLEEGPYNGPLVFERGWEITLLVSKHGLMINSDSDIVLHLDTGVQKEWFALHLMYHSKLNIDICYIREKINYIYCLNK